jgi:hypothetical protein
MSRVEEAAAEEAGVTASNRSFTATLKCVLA